MSDDFGDSDDDALIYAATQVEPTQSFQSTRTVLPPPAKRRRISRPTEDSDVEDAFDPAPLPNSEKFGARTKQTTPTARPDGFTSTSRQQLDGPSSPFGELGDSDAECEVVETLDDELERKAAERAQVGNKNARYLIHVPKQQRDVQDQFYTQPPSAITQPHVIRGPIWRKPQKSQTVQERFEIGEDSGIGFDEREQRARQRGNVGNDSLRSVIARSNARYAIVAHTALHIV